jgi:hypothetical protein
MGDEREACMGEHPSDDRDENGQFRPGYSGNPGGKPARKPFLKLLAAAEACGARVVVEVPVRAAPRPSARRRPADDLPPAA